MLTTILPPVTVFQFFFFNETAPTEIYTLSLHDALPISNARIRAGSRSPAKTRPGPPFRSVARSEEHTSELQSRRELVCRLLLEQKKNQPEQDVVGCARRSALRDCGGGRGR